MSEISKLSFYSLALVAANKPLSSKIIEATPIEDLPFAHGQVTDNSNKQEASSTDASGSAYKTSVVTADTVKAGWLPMGGSNRLTAPDVRRGETVVLYRFADSDEFFWSTILDDCKLRKLETVIYGFSGTRNESAEPDANNMYYMEVSTHKKIVHFHTSNADGEPFVYDIQINAAEGYIQIQDDDNNFFLLNSKERLLEMANGDNSSLKIDKKNISFECSETLSMKSKVTTITSDASITLKSPDNRLD